MRSNAFVTPKLANHIGAFPSKGFSGEAFQNHKGIIYASFEAEPGLIVWLLFTHHHSQSVVMRESGSRRYING